MSTIRLSNDEVYALEFVEGLPASYTCTNCHQFLGDAYQNVECGDRFCRVCVRLITNGAKKCPECSALMTKETTFVDAAVRREMDGLEVYCPFKRFHCEETLLYRNLQDHIETCLKKPVGPVASAAIENSNITMSSVAGDAGAARQMGEMGRQLQTPEESTQDGLPFHGSLSIDDNGASSTSVTASSSADRSGITHRNVVLTEHTDVIGTSASRSTRTALFGLISLERSVRTSWEGDAVHVDVRFDGLLKLLRDVGKILFFLLPLFMLGTGAVFLQHLDCPWYEKVKMFAGLLIATVVVTGVHVWKSF